MDNHQLQTQLAKFKGSLAVRFVDTGSDASTITYKLTKVEKGVQDTATGPVPMVFIEGVPAS